MAYQHLFSWNLFLNLLFFFPLPFRLSIEPKLGSRRTPTDSSFSNPLFNRKELEVVWFHFKSCLPCFLSLSEMNSQSFPKGAELPLYYLYSLLYKYGRVNFA